MSGGREVDVEDEPGDGVFLEAHAGDEEAVDDVDRAQAEIDFAAGGKDQDAGDNVVLAAGVATIEAERISGGGVYELGAR